MWRFGPMGPGGWNAHPWWWLVLGRIVPFLILVALVALVVWAFMRLSRDRALAAAGVGGTMAMPPSAGSSPRPDAALDQVRIRYARGEIGREDFLRLSRDLGGDAPDAGGDALPGEAGAAPQG